MICLPRQRFLNPSDVVLAYCNGYFPMADHRRGASYWYSPDPRCIMPLGAFHTPRRLRRTIAQGRFEVRIDTAFKEVIRACAARPETWISEEIEQVFGKLSEAGLAHSFEVWRNGQLAGGVYGLSLGGSFFAESMFSRVRDASKVALVLLLEHLRSRDFSLFDVQYPNDHLRQFGPILIPREEYLERLAAAITQPASGWAGELTTVFSSRDPFDRLRAGSSLRSG